MTRCQFLYPVKYLLLLMLMMTSVLCSGQRLAGRVIDKNTGQPVNGATVSLGKVTAFTDLSGGFSITASAGDDSVKVTHWGYKTYTAALSRMIATVVIMLEPADIKLKEVVIRSDRRQSFKQDSIDNRVNYAKQFNYTGPKVMDAFTGNTNRQPGELISINPVLLIAALTKKSTPEYKFHKILLRDEQSEYISQKFNRGIVSKITGLKGDTLATFVVNYRPTYPFAKKATDYDMEVYIKARYKEFKKDGVKGNDPFGKP